MLNWMVTFSGDLILRILIMALCAYSSGQKRPLRR